MKMNNTVAAISLLLAAVPTLSSAADENKNTQSLNPWVDCGIGAMIFSETPVGAVISNIIWDLGTTAVSSNISSQNTCKGKNVKVAQFIGTTYANLVEETVKGDGQHIYAMLDIMGCNPSSHTKMIDSIRSDFSQSIRNPAYVEKTSLVKFEEYYNIVQAKVTGEYVQQCQAL